MYFIVLVLTRLLKGKKNKGSPLVSGGRSVSEQIICPDAKKGKKYNLLYVRILKWSTLAYE